MSVFAGFPEGKLRLVPVPDLFFSDLLPRVDDLAELQVSLHMLWFLYRQSGYPRYMTLEELESEGTLLSALQRSTAAASDSPVQVLHGAVEKAVGRGTLLQLVISDEAGETTYLFMNTAQGRRAVTEVKAGDLLLERTGRVREAHIDRPRPNVFQLYEDNIGLLQPLLAEELSEAAGRYPETWIEDAFRIAVERNVRNWRYIRGILERWENEGRDAAGHRRGRAH